MFADALGVPSEAATILGVLLTLVGVGAGFAIRSIKRYISAEIGVVNKKVTPNGGDTDEVGDRVKRIEEGQAEMLSEVRAANNAIQRHLGWHDRDRLKVR